MALPNKDQLKFHSYQDAKLLMEAIEKRYGGNKESKKVQRTLLKQHYENFAALSSEIMDLTFDRSLPSERKTHALIWRNKVEIETISLDDLYNNLKIYEPELTNNTAHEVSTTNTQGNGVNSTSLDNLYDAVIRAFLAMDTPTQNALIAQDGIRGYDWSYQAKEEQPTNHALMAFTSSRSYSSSDSEVDACSKTCVKAYATLKEQYDSLSSNYKISQFNLVSYKAGLESVEARLAHYKKNEVVFEESINVLKLEVRLRDNALIQHRINLEKAEKERDRLKQTLEKFQNSSKSLNNILESQVIDKLKIGLGYDAATAASPTIESFVNFTNKSGSDKGCHYVPPPLIGNFIPHKLDLTFKDEIFESENLDVTIVVTPCNDKTVENKGVSNTVEYNAFRMNNTSAPIIEDWNSDDESEIDYIVRPSTEKIKSVKTVRETDASKQNKQNPRGNQRNWNNLMVKHTTARDRAVVSENKGKGANVVKASACWIQVNNGLDPQKSLILLFYGYGNPQQKEYKEKAVIDSGCSRHMTGNKCYLDEYEDYDGGFVSFGDGKGRISGKGKIKTGSLDFDDVYFCKELKYNLFSVSQICDKKNNVLFTDTECLVLSSNFKLLDESQVLLRVPRKDNIYSVDLKSVVPTGGLTCLIAKATIDESNTWHRRLGHINFKTMNKLVKGNLVKGLPLKIFENDHSCVACQKGKQHKASYKTKLVNSISKPLHMLHMDLFGPTNVKSLMKKSYCLVVTDDFSRFSWVFFLATKDETSGILKTFITEIENQLDHKGIKREFSMARTPQQNGIAERKNRTLIEAARTMVLVIKPQNKTPYELIHGRPPLIDFMKPFGCLITILNTRDHLGKFDGKADEGYFVGYSVTKLLFNVDSLTISMNYVPVAARKKTNSIVGTKDNFVAGQAQKEKEPEQEYILIPLCTTNPLISQGPKDYEGDAGMNPTEVDENEASDKNRKHDQEARSESERLNKKEMQTEHTNSSNGINIVSTPVSTVGPSFDIAVPSTPVNTAGPSVSTANESEEQLFERFSPFKNAFTLPPVLNVSLMDNTGIFGNAYDDEDLEEEVDMNNVISSYSVPDTSFTKFHKDHPEDQVIGSLKTPVQTRHMTKITEEHGLFSLVHKLRRTNHKDFHNCLFAYFLSQMEPKKPVQALKDPSWVEAMQDENKKDERCIVVKNKARLVAQVYQMDVKSAFLYGKIEEEVYVYQPPGFKDPHFPDKVYKVEKALYGLHQAPRAWYETLSTYLLDNGFHKGQIDKTLFIKRHKDDILLVQVYVDDIIFGSTKKQISNEFETLMHDKFQMSSMGELSFFLGLQVKQKSDGIFISQDKYVAGILKKFDFASIKTASTPMETNKALIKDKEAEDVDVHLYRLMFGSLMYLTASRPGIMFVVYACARFQVTPKISHFNSMKRIFRYLKGQPKLGLWYPKDSPFDLEAFSDSNYVGASLDRKSTTGGCQFLGKRLISWQCKKQPIIANSTTKAEYVAAAN
ncbi:putative ribonuclease H-like domain-containing protein [Tanacetum coccineum]